mgnify:CR=1 FL=1
MTAQQIKSLAALEDFGRERLSPSFYMREFLYSEVSNWDCKSNIPDDRALALKVGRELCQTLLEPLNATFGRIAIRSAFRSAALNGYCNEMAKQQKAGYSCAENRKNFAGHIWDHRDEEGLCGATACIVVPWFAERYENGADWRALAYWMHDHLPYSTLEFFPRLCAVNVSWHERPKKTIHSHIKPKGHLLRNAHSEHGFGSWYPDFPSLKLR